MSARFFWSVLLLLQLFDFTGAVWQPKYRRKCMLYLTRLALSPAALVRDQQFKACNYVSAHSWGDAD